MIKIRKLASRTFLIRSSTVGLPGPAGRGAGVIAGVAGIGRGGVGKTTIARRAVEHWKKTREVVSLSVESLDANALYSEFLGQNLEQFLEIGDRGTYLDREELRRFFELSLPGVDEHDGFVRVESKPGEGTTFTVELPTATERMKDEG